MKLDKTFVRLMILACLTIYIPVCLFSSAGQAHAYRVNDSLNKPPLERKKVLVLNSYHHGMDWTDSILDGVKSVLSQNPEVELYIEFMDTKRNMSPGYLLTLYELYKTKFNDKKFDAIIASDDDAYNFLLQYQQELFPKVPVVFCGVNFFQDKDLEQRKYFTGITESFDIKQTVDLALKLHPYANKVVVINDQTSTGIANSKRVQEITPDFPKVQFDYFVNMDMWEVLERTATLSRDSLILLMSFNQDKSNNIYSYDESIRLIASQAKVPIYGLWDFYLDRGIVGGMLTDGRSQGELAARTISRILKGEKPENIPVVKESPNRFMFDHDQLERFQIALDKLPADSIVINRPPSLFAKHQTTIWSGLFAVTAFFIILQRKKENDYKQSLRTTNEQLRQEIDERRRAVEALRSQAHEFMNKLHAILGMVHLECYDQLTGYVKMIARQYQDEGGFASRQIKDPVLAGFLLGKYYRARELGIELSVSEDSFLPHLNDPELSHELVTIVGNLVDNALDAVEDSNCNQVSMHFASTEGLIRFEVRDKGSGISDELKERIFAKGFSTKADNRGFGLFLVLRSLERFQGTIEVVSTVEQGTHFIVNIPLRLKEG